MPKRRAPKKINQEIIKAVQLLTNQNPYVTVKLADIVETVKYQVKEMHFKQNLDKLIRESVYKLKELGLIEHIGFNQYCCADCFLSDEIEDKTEVQPTKPDSRYFLPYARKSTLENSSSLNPNRRKRHAENESSCSLSGNEIERTRKRFYGRKVVKKDEHNPPLPGARQVPDRKEESTNSEEESAHALVRNAVEIQETPTCSWKPYKSYVTIVPRRCCNIIQLSKSDDELIRSVELFDTEAENNENLKLSSDMLEVYGKTGARNIRTSGEMKNQANNIVDLVVNQEQVEQNENHESIIEEM